MVCGDKKANWSESNLNISIKNAILHILDFQSDISVFSEEPVDFAEDSIYQFISKHIEKALTDPNRKQGELIGGSHFSSQLAKYASEEASFVSFSKEIAGEIYEQIKRSDHVEPVDILMAEFEIDSVRYLGIFFLTYKAAYTHRVVTDDGKICNEIIEYKALLPGISQKLDSFAVVNVRSLRVDFVDRKRNIDGSDIYILPDAILKCTSDISAKDALKMVTTITAKVADEFGDSSAVAVSKTKNYVYEKAEFSSFSPVSLSKDVFEESEEMQQAFIREIEKAGLPEEIRIDKQYAVRTGKNHKIKTDTGIEITFPAEYFDNPQFLEFITNPDGTISIALKNIGKITNR